MMKEENRLPLSKSPKIVVSCDRENCDYNKGGRCSMTQLILSWVNTELIDSSGRLPRFYKASIPACYHRGTKSIDSDIKRTVE